MREIFIGAGQSNMSGRGVLGNPVYDNISRVWNYCANGVWQNAPVDPVDSPICQVDAVSADPDAAVGPLLSFANRLAELRNTDIGIVPCAKGGTSITEWYRDLRRITLYGSMIARAKEAAQSGVIKGLIWWQGESDCSRSEVPPHDACPSYYTWPADFAAFVANVRTDLGDPNLPVVFAQLSKEPSGIWAYAAWGGMQQQQAQISIPRVSMIITSDLPVLAPNDPHVNAAGQYAAGVRFADAMQVLIV